MVMPLTMHTALEGSTGRISMILSIGIAGITILTCMIPSTHGIHLHGHSPGDGDIAGTHPIPITVMDMAIHPITVTGAAATTDGVIPTDHITVMEDTVVTTVDTMVVTMVVITIAAGMPTQIITGMEEDLQAQPMFVTETEQTGI